MTSTKVKPFFLWRHLNVLRWISLTMVFSMIIVIPLLSIYQSLDARHAYDLMQDDEKKLYDFVDAMVAPVLSDPENDLDLIKGTTWSGRFFDFSISDPLAVLSHIASRGSFYSAFILSALIPIVFTVFFGRFFCGWICPATFLYELNGRLSSLLSWLGLYNVRHRLRQKKATQFKYLILLTGTFLSAITGVIVFSSIYPPAILGREFCYLLMLGGIGSGMTFFAVTLVFDLLVVKRGFCRYLCPGGALYSLLGRYRLVRIKRIVENCDDCAKCNKVCEFGLDPLNDHFGQECNNCTACIAACPSEAMTFVIQPRDVPPQGVGHLSKRYKQHH